MLRRCHLSQQLILVKDQIDGIHFFRAAFGVDFNNFNEPIEYRGSNFPSSCVKNGCDVLPVRRMTSL